MLAAVTGCVGTEGVAVSEAELSPDGTHDDVVLDPLARVPAAVDDIRQWVRDATVQLNVAGGGVCTGTLVSPRIVLTSAHCIGDIAGTGGYQVVFGPANGNGPASTTVVPRTVYVDMADCIADPVAGLVGSGCRQACPRLPGGGDPAFCLDGGHWGHDIAAVILDERVDVGVLGLRQSPYRVVPAQIDLGPDPNCPDPSCDPWVGTSLTIVGYGRQGTVGTPNHDTFDALRRWGNVGITGCAGGLPLLAPDRARG